MFNSYPEGKAISAQECKSNYEEMAARLKKRIDADKKCFDGMIAGIENGSVNLRSDQDVLYYAVIGVLSRMIPKYEKEYENLLKKIEEEK